MHESESGSISSTTSSGDSGGESARQEAQRLGEQAREQARHLQRQASERGTQMLEERKGWVTGEVDAVAHALHRSADELSADGSGAAQYAHWAADALDRVSQHLHQKDVKSLLRETQDFARREPGIVIGGALAVGFALTRFLKSSEPHHRESSSEEHFSQQRF